MIQRPDGLTTNGITVPYDERGLEGKKDYWEWRAGGYDGAKK